MNNAIKAGDLVMVVKAGYCCGNSQSLGKVFKVNAISNQKLTVCRCGNYRTDDMAEGSIGLVEISRLIKIDPPALQDETENEKELAL